MPATRVFNNDSNGSLPTIDMGSKIVKPDTCNLSVGCISNINVWSNKPGIVYAWFNSNGELISINPKLVNVGIGNYHLQITDGNGCTVTSDTILVYNENIIPHLLFTTKSPFQNLL